MSTKTATRSIDIELEIQVTPEAVWKALTDPRELTRWFPLEARVEPGPGGAIALSWGPGLQGENPIRTWEPEKRLVTGWFQPTEAFGSSPHESVAGSSDVFREDRDVTEQLAVDYRIEGRGGATILRMVHSGFSADARWDEEYEGHGRGWTFELRSLRHYLENHRGKKRHVAWVRQEIPADARQEVWSRLMSPAALVAGGTLKGRSPGERYAVTTAHGEKLEGEVLIHKPPVEFAGTAENLDRALVRCGVETCFGPPVVHFWASTWGGDGSRAAGLEDRWRETLSRLAGR